MTWYNKYRPLSFDDVVGQELVKQVLQNSLQTSKIKHSYLLMGPKGTGKTTMARIFANSLNCVSENPQASLDIIEMDAASNTGIDDIRFLTEVAQVPPISGKYKIYIIDEVHMLSKNAMNALLKILEEPPKYLIFLLATTNPEKLLPTVMSRLTKLNLSSHTIEGLVGRLRYIADQENINISDQALEIIAGRSSGGQRDAINHLETVASFDLESYDQDNVSELLGLVNQALIGDIVDSLVGQSINNLLTQQLAGLSVDGQLFLGQIFEFVLDKSLGGNSDYDSLINPMAEVISYHLPILTPLSVLAILQSKLGLRVFQKAPANSPSVATSPIELKKKPQPVASPALEQEVKLQLPPAPIEIKSQIPAPIELNLSQIQKFLQELNRLGNTPPTLKMCLQDIQVMNIKDDIISLTVSNGFFLGLINNPINQKFLKSELMIRFGAGFVMVFGIRDNQVPIQTISADSTSPKSIEPELAPKEIKQLTRMENQLPADGIFYEAFKSLKPGMENMGIKIHAPAVETTLPTASNNPDLDMFDNLISDLDLE
ncbi:MAG: DNA polymerase III subunit gamma/tau [Candidatus Parcubacteria bacterium]|nr:DNA polymerase III subunit gamma/tau [Candidatus Paceibacterota bacterium]